MYFVPLLFDFPPSPLKEVEIFEIHSNIYWKFKQQYFTIHRLGLYIYFDYTAFFQFVNNVQICQTLPVRLLLL